MSDRKRKVSRGIALFILIAAVASALLVHLGAKHYLIHGTDLISPAGLLSAKDGTFYVADSGLNAVLWYEGDRTENVAGYTMPYQNGEPKGGFLDAQVGLALFNKPYDMEEWAGGIVVSDRDNNMIRLIKDGMVSTLAGTLEPGEENGFAEHATFNQPCGLAVDKRGYLLIADTGNGKIRRITDDMRVQTLISGLNKPTGLQWKDDTLYIADRGDNCIYTWKDDELKLLAGTGSAGREDGPAEMASFTEPTAVLVTDDCIYIADTGNSAIRKLEDGEVTTHMIWERDPKKPWPGRPTALEEHNGKIYAADGFAGVVFEVKR